MFHQAKILFQPERSDPSRERDVEQARSGRKSMEKKSKKL
jgi:hypothetical protein